MTTITFDTLELVDKLKNAGGGSNEKTHLYFIDFKLYRKC